MNIQQLLQEIEPLPYKRRIQYIIDIGRRSLTDPSLQDILRDMEQEGFYERTLCLHACLGNRNSMYAMSALNDSSAIIRQQAVKIVPLLCDQTQVRQVLSSIPSDISMAFMKRIYKAGFQQAIDDYIETLANNNDYRLSILLPFGSSTIAEHYLPRVINRLQIEQWKRLAKLQPELVIKIMQEQSEIDNELDVQYINRLNTTIPILVEQDAHGLLTLIQSLAARLPLNQLDLQPLLLKYPQETIDLYLAFEQYFEIDLTSIVQHISLERIQILLQGRHINIFHIKDWFHRLPPLQRLELYTTVLHTFREKDGVFPVEIIKFLPQTQREQEAHYYWSSATISADNLKGRIDYAPFLSWDEAVNHLSAESQQSDIARRRNALEALAQTVIYHRSHLHDLLAIFSRHLNEPDPVREKMFAGLLKLPPGIWQSHNLREVEQLIKVACTSTEVSKDTLSTIFCLLIRLIPSQPEFAYPLIVETVKMHSFFEMPCQFDNDYNELTIRAIERYLTTKDAQRLALSLLPVIDSWIEQQKFAELLTCAEEFGRHLSTWTGLLHLLEQALQHMQDVEIAEKILLLLLKWSSQQIDRLIPVLLQQDASWILLPSITAYVQRHRQDLLSKYLGQTTIKGRFCLEEKKFIMPMRKNFRLLTYTQQAMFAYRLEQELPSLDFADTHVKVRAIRRLGLLPAIPPIRLVTLIENARTTGRLEEGLYRHVALQALSRHDTGQYYVDTFVQQLQQPDAYKEFFAFRNLMKRLPETEVFTLTTAISSQRIMIQKECIHLLGTLHLEEAYQKLLALAATKDIHPDVYIAIIQALWQHLDRAETWEILTRAANDPSGKLVAQIGKIPLTILTLQEKRRVLTLFKNILDHSTNETRQTFLQCLADIPLRDEEQILTPALIQLIHSENKAEYQLAIKALKAFCTNRDTAFIQEAIRKLRTEKSQYQRIQIIEAVLVSFSIQENRRRYPVKTRKGLKEIQSIVRAILVELATDPITITLRLQATLRILPIQEFLTVLVQAAQTHTLHAEAVMTICANIHPIAKPYSFFDDLQHPLIDDLRKIETSLADQPDERLRRIALSALFQQASYGQHTEQWTPSLLQRLQIYQDDPSPLIAGAALVAHPKAL